MISFNKFTVLFPALTCAKAIGIFEAFVYDLAFFV